MNEVDKKVNSYIKRARIVMEIKGDTEDLSKEMVTTLLGTIVKVAEMIQLEEYRKEDWMRSLQQQK